MTRRSGSLYERVAARLDRDPDQVREELRDLGLQTELLQARDRSLRVNRLRVAGTKGDGTAFDRTFEFDPGGVTVIAAPNNSGKSSLLKTIKLCLRGREETSPDVLDWLDAVECHALVNGRPMRFTLTLNGGDIVRGVVTEQTGSGDRVLLDADTQFGYAELLNDLMMRELDLAEIVSAKGEEKLVDRWPTYFSAVYLPGSGSKVLIGNHTAGGVPGRLLSLFIDVPGASTGYKAQTIRKNVEASTAHQDRDNAWAVLAARIVDFNERLADVRRRIRALPDPHEPGRIVELTERVEELARRRGQLAADCAAAENARVTAESESRAAAKRARIARETVEASRLLGALQPTICPGCEGRLDARTAVTVDEDHCRVCVEPLDKPAEDLTAEADALDAAADEAAAALDGARAEVDRLDTELARVTAELADATGTLDTLRVSATEDERQRLRTEEAGITIALDALADVPLPEKTGVDEPDAALIDAYLAELPEPVRKGHPIAEELNTELLDVARRLGVANLADVALDGRGALMIRKNEGAQTSFSKDDVTPGERHRFRIATVSALMTVANRHGRSTHPGLLIIDSLFNEEIDTATAPALLGQLRRLADDPGIQVITTTAEPELIGDAPVSIITPDNPDGTLW